MEGSNPACAAKWEKCFFLIFWWSNEKKVKFWPKWPQNVNFEKIFFGNFLKKNEIFKNNKCLQNIWKWWKMKKMKIDQSLCEIRSVIKLHCDNMMILNTEYTLCRIQISVEVSLGFIFTRFEGFTLCRLLWMSLKYSYIHVSNVSMV